MTARAHLQLMSKPRLVHEVEKARKDAAEATELAEAWRAYADQVAAIGTSDRHVLSLLRTLIRASRASRNLTN